MFRIATVGRRPAQLLSRRSLASSVLLTRSWGNETVVQLRKEAKARGLSSKGTKALLIQRLEEYEANSIRQAPSPSNSRQASTAATAAPTASSNESSATAAAEFMNIKIPDFHPEPERGAPVPFLPDYIGTGVPTGPGENFVPKLVVVAGANTHIGGGPAHASVDATDPAPLSQVAGGAESQTQKPAAASTTEGGLFFDIAQDLGLLNQVPAPKPRPQTSFWQWFG
ncbi:hypothetical protein CC1G_04193 [Coprinopsis cinerea okayama7|uniref:SAP domain-containing protein n=1 Tax=Coprinopsis cinerea (strain Okayama-7 / 130 / ATCC MYA-4618 / FGSC 9003) TaxID=240176 RepID=A8NF71_COPC7|nr:hypothetical protein CC1G_04193 [Coprinopsis cinerea okayama7\|eukprot:XP_001833214.2 hypothetical protein CC1G_04193 [Coprinopsis cinerea okayama7\